MQPVSKQIAQAFAEALLANHGNATAAARTLQYENAKDIGHRYARHPLVLAALAPMAQQHLSSLTPKAIQTLNSLLTAGSPYVRLEAAKDILDRNGVGTSREPPKSSQLVVNINLSGSSAPALAHAPLLDIETTTPQRGDEVPPLENSGTTSVSTSPAHDFSGQVVAAPAHDFFSAVSAPVQDIADAVLQPLAEHVTTLSEGTKGDDELLLTAASETEERTEGEQGGGGRREKFSLDIE